MGTTYTLKGSGIHSTGLAFIHEHGGLHNYPWVGDDLIPRGLQIPNIILGDDVISVVEISGGEYRVRVLYGKFTPDDIKVIRQLLPVWQAGNQQTKMDPKQGTINGKKVDPGSCTSYAF